ncbi:hypothetical protein A2U01_0102367, partial [Trifolium medium]|nr:hypothetical protein [Trifolium medium]
MMKMNSSWGNCAEEVVLVDP